MEEKSKRRGGNAIFVCGTNNTGKTVEVRKLIEMFNKRRDNYNKNDYPSSYHKLILFDPQNRLQDLTREGDVNIMSNEDDWFEKIVWQKNSGKYDGLKDSLIVLDDFKLLFAGNNVMPKGLRDLMAYRMEFGLDIIFVAWHPRHLLPDLVTFIDKYLLFKINSDDKEYCSRIEGEKQTVIGFKKTLNMEFQSYSDVEYEKLYPNFPYIYYDSGRNKAVKMNFRKK